MARDLLAGAALEPFGIRWHGGVEVLWNQYQGMSGYATQYTSKGRRRAGAAPV